MPTVLDRASGSQCPESHPAEARLGGAEYYRIWCSATDIPANKYQSVEFCGWLIGWGASDLAAPLEAFRFGDAGVATRAELDIFLANDGRIVTALELLPATAWEFASSPPDMWATFLGWHASLDDAKEWLKGLEPYHSPRGDCRATGDAMRQAENALAALPLGGGTPVGRGTRSKRKRRKGAGR